MAGKIFLLQEGNKLVEMEEREYISEDILQDLIANYPNLLAGYEMDQNEPRKWLLVQRELFLYCEDEYGSDKFYLDHLFLDQDGIPTIVETKLSSNSELRRQVVAQMLDYSSNALIYLPVEEIKTILNSTYPEKNEIELFKEELGLEVNPEEYWKQVQTNLQKGKIRLVFVADFIPTKLRTMVEFLNIQMDPAEVFCVEVKQYVGEGLKTFVPQYVEQKSDIKNKIIFSNEKLNESTFFEYLDNDGVVFFKKLLDFAHEKQLLIEWTPKGFSLNLVRDKNKITILRGYCKFGTYGQTLFTTISDISTKVPDGDSILDEYRKGLEKIGKKVTDGYSFNIEYMDEEKTEKLYEILINVIDRIRT